MTPWLLLATLVLAGATSLVATPLVRRFATHLGMLDATGERRMHEVPKPRIGGIAVYLGFAFALFSVVGFMLSRGMLSDVHDIHDVLGMLFGGTLILAVGIWDDVMGLAPRAKLAAQLLVAAISLLYGFLVPFVENPLHHGAFVYFPLWLSIIVTLVWYAGMMNAINFIDGLDGLLSGLTAIEGAWLVGIYWTHGQQLLAIVMVALVGAALGFLRYNFNPASIILGDTGALFIGYIFATASIVGNSKAAIAINLAIPLLALALPVLDTAAAIVRRTRAGKKIYEADRGHFHHQLVFRFGMNVRGAVLLIYALCFVLGAVAWWISGGSLPHKLV